MNTTLIVAQVVSALGFAGYGIACLTSTRMKAEFVRFQVPRLRIVTGSLQIAASAGLFLGLGETRFALAASLGLCLMMLCAMWVRLRIRDPLSGFIQALACFALNVYILQAHLAVFLQTR
jgi:hypothetical protein